MWTPATPKRPWSEARPGLSVAGALPWAGPAAHLAPSYKNLHGSSLWVLFHQPTWRQVIKQEEEGDGWMRRAESHVVP